MILNGLLEIQMAQVRLCDLSKPNLYRTNEKMFAV